VSRERSFRGSRDGQERDLDWYALARERGIPYREAQRIHDAARELAAQQGQDQIQEIYVGLLEQARPAAGRPSPGKVTHTMRRQSRKGRRAQQAGPGKVTLTSYLGPGRAGAGGEAAPEVEPEGEASDILTWLASQGHRIDGARASQPPEVEPEGEASDILTWLASQGHRIDGARASQPSEVEPEGEASDILTWLASQGHRIDGARASQPREAVESNSERWLETVLDLVLGRVPAGERGEGAEPADAELAHGRAIAVPEDIRARMERVFGHDFGHVQIVSDSDRAKGASHALTQADEVHSGRDPAGDAGATAAAQAGGHGGDDTR
jgi:hypothetical protein